MIKCIDNFDSREVKKLQNILFKQPALHRHIRQLKETNIFHHALNYAIYQSSEQDTADVQTLQVLIDHEVSYCAQNQGKFNINVGFSQMSKLTMYRKFPSLQHARHRWQKATTGVYS